MAVAWKKVLTDGTTITVPNGGTGSTNLAGGAVLIGNGGSPITALSQEANELVIGQIGALDPLSLGPDDNSDVKIAVGAGSTHYFATIQPDAVEGSMVKDNDLDWVTHEGTGTAYTVPHYDTNGDAAVSTAPSSSGDVLTYNGSAVVWAAAGAASTLTINDITNDNNVTGYLGFSTATSGPTQFNIDQGFKVNLDPNSDNGVSTLSINGGIADVTDAEGFFVQAAASAADFGNSYVKAVRFAGTADRARGAFLTGGAQNNTTYEIPLIDVDPHTEGFATGRRFYNNQLLKAEIDNSGKPTLVVSNLSVTGTTTSINTTTLDVEDHSVRISVPNTGEETLNDNSTVSQGEVGIIVGYNTNADENMPRVVYKGYQDSVSVLGWRVAQGADNNAGSTATAYGVGIMHVDAAALSTTGGASGLSIGVGAMAIDNAGDLWLQTAV